LLFTGWGSTCDVWKPIIPALCERYQVNCHAPAWVEENTMKSSMQDFDQYVDELALSLEEPVDVVAWSMGGLLAIALANKFPEKVKKICFISSVPTFVSNDDENAGIDFEWFQNFRQQYHHQSIKTLKRFITMQVQGDNFAKATLNQLKSISSFECYDLIECGFGLDLLSKLNLKKELVSLKQEICFIHGCEDVVVNVQAAQHAALIADAPIYLIEQAAHVPHLSHSQDVLNVINQTFNS